VTPLPVRLERRESVGVLVLDRTTKLNALTFDMWREIPPLASEADADPDLNVLLVTGADESAFSAGADINEFETRRGDARVAAEYNAAVREAEEAIAGMRKPTIAFIRGVCIGGGCGLALACDVRLCDTTARFAITASKLGIVYSLPATKRLVDVVGPSRAKYILYSSETIDAHRALAYGLVDDVFDSVSSAEQAPRFAEVIASRAPLSLQASKELVRRIVAGQLADDAETIALRDAAFDSEDYQGRVQAFARRRATQSLGGNTEGDGGDGRNNRSAP
jgi:enoyl-CoA hydratase/carnithine racemase